VNKFGQALTGEHPDAMPDDELDRLAMLLTVPRADSVLI